MAESTTLPTIKEVQSRVHDANGNRIDLEALVTNIVTIPSSAEGGDLLPGRVFFVEAKSGAAFILVDEQDVRHVAAGKKLATLKPGNPQRPAYWEPQHIIPHQQEKAARGNAQSIKTNSGRRQPRRKTTPKPALTLS